EYNPTQPSSYNLNELPMHKEEDYLETISKLATASSKQQCIKITKETEVSHLPLCAASQAFIHPTFFPMDPFHLFYKNCMAHIWDIWITSSNSTERMHVPENKACQFGETIVAAMKTLPPAFCGPVRDPFLKRNSQYKVYEWMALLHWYILPIGMELGFDAMILANFSHFVSAIEFVMSIKACSEHEVASLHVTVQKFLLEFESLYWIISTYCLLILGMTEIFGSFCPENITRSHLCVFQLIHIAMHIKWNGSIRISSQATVERSIGEVGHKIRSNKAPFANLANIITEKELLRVLKLYYPTLVVDSILLPGQIPRQPAYNFKEHKLIQNIGISRKDIEKMSVLHEIEAVKQINMIPTQYQWKDGEKYNFPMVMHYAQTGEGDSKKIIFGEATAFYEFKIDNICKKSVIVYRKLTNVIQTLNQTTGKWNDNQIYVMEVTNIIDIVGIWESKNGSGNVYVLRKHPGTAFLTTEELGAGTE
ncbi:hypothetical protein BDQ17DRAFT_1218084, partial [Cyathus striatus]